MDSIDASHAIACLQQEFSLSAYEMQRPSVLFRPALSIDGSKWCALYGADLQAGVAGFGDSPDAAMRDFDEQWCMTLQERCKTCGFKVAECSCHKQCDCHATNR